MGSASWGRAAIRDDIAQLLGMWTEITNLLVADNQYIKEWVMTGVHTGDLPGLPATGKPFRISGCGVGLIRYGEIANATEYWNMAEFLIQVGILPPPGQ
jgi:steroid delta-isomerase-like uncharacterized protein